MEQPPFREVYNNFWVITVINMGEALAHQTIEVDQNHSHLPTSEADNQVFKEVSKILDQ